MDTNNSIIPVVPTVEAVDRPKIREYTTTQVYNPLVVLIGRLYMLRGQQADTNDLRFQASELEEELRRSYSLLSLEEVRIALDNGVKKKYGEYFGLNVITYLDWIREYVRSEQRNKALEESRQRKLPPPHVKTTEEIEASTISGLLIRWEWWAKKDRLFYIPDPEDEYRLLIKRELITPTDTQKTAAFNEARQRLVEEQKKNELAINRRGGLNTISNILNKYKESNIVEKLDRGAVVAFAKCIIIGEYFQTLADKNQSLKDMFPAKIEAEM